MFYSHALSEAAAHRRLAAVVAALLTAAMFLAFSAQNAGAAATLNVSTDASVVGSSTSLTLNTALSGSGNAKKQYGATLTIPGALRVSYPAYGNAAQQCPVSSYSALNTGITPLAQAFDNTNCPAEARVGTATLGAASGGIYWVSTSPLPQLGVYFDTGVSSSYGRRLSVSYNGSSPTLMVNGLPKTSTNGLTLSFDNPSRPTLPTKIWEWIGAADPECTPTPTFSGSVRTWPNFGTVATNVSMASKALALRGCGISFTATTDANQAGASTGLTLNTTLAGTGADTMLYSQRVTLPPSLRVSYPAYGSSAQQCPAASLTNIDTGYTPITQAFNASLCPPEAKVGTATLGSATGSIYIVTTSPLPSFGVYFDGGVATPYGRRMYHTYNGDSAPILQLSGLPNTSSNGLELKFDNPSRPTLNPKIWEFATSNDPDCASANASMVAYLFPSSGTIATQIPGFTSYINVNGCTG